LSNIIFGGNYKKNILIAKNKFYVSGRTNMHFDFTKEQAIEWLQKQE